MEKTFLTFVVNGNTFIYTAEINNRCYLGELSDHKYIHINTTIFNKFTEGKLKSGYVECLDKVFNKDSGESPLYQLKAFVEKLSSNINHNKYDFEKNLMEFIKNNYLIKKLAFDRLEEKFSNNKNLECTFDNDLYLRVSDESIEKTTVKVYPYIYDNVRYLHVIVHYYDRDGYDVFAEPTVYEIELSFINDILDQWCYKATIEILTKIEKSEIIIPRIKMVLPIVETIRYCFNNTLDSIINSP